MVNSAEKFAYCSIQKLFFSKLSKQITLNKQCYNYIAALHLVEYNPPKPLPIPYALWFGNGNFGWEHREQRDRPL